MLSLISVDLQKSSLETLVVPVCADREIHSDGDRCRPDPRSRKAEEFSGEKDEEVVFY